ncbi:5'-methylthioadenosine/S-adenosylhomocysteine nucleosidase [Ramlibacter sp. USB13]|uniref:5'-methylthioadenosine/S-adenosylhomocysteine nucleosidase n=1 Tax=Ramlibacter cellulosilyticus TaxID=2764187 RepID=A0A923SDI7_9BURK|nr:5'-methylthioadenosine/S-adenosylhomocysteine nucleosidase [Ramlibacter cellulosilyticus]MBC5785368.1 5'-methylthioadenosine/S-adenosylhomocysteine nucleosidase [Ramlibacter cellulosilyticus]
MVRRLLAAALAAAALLLQGCAGTPAAPAATATQSASLDPTPRIAIVSAFQPELVLLRSRLAQPRVHQANGVEFATGTLQGKPVVLFLSGVSMVNAAMNTQLALDRFRVTHLVVSGIAGGVNPQLHVGDVTVAQRWGQYMEVLAAREVAPGRFQPPPFMKDATIPPYGIFHPRPVEVRSAAKPEVERRFWFDTDPAMLAVARQLQGVALERCDAERRCLTRTPRVVPGGNGVSGQAFVDNAAYREYTFRTFEANVLDMETAAIAHVAHANGVPFIAFRSLSDLAGGGEGENEMGTFFRIAADNSARVLLAFLAAWK